MDGAENDPRRNPHRRPRTRGANKNRGGSATAVAASSAPLNRQPVQSFYNSELAAAEQWSSEVNNEVAENTYGRPPSWLLALAGQEAEPSVHSQMTFQTQQAYGLLNPNAKPFVPRRVPFPSPPSNRQESPRVSAQPRRPAVSTDNSSTENLRDRLTEQLERETYECMICCQAIFANHWLWSCSQCFHMFHLHRSSEKSCITRWALKSFDDEHGWRCPSCQQTNRDLPREYRCFCGKEVQPRTRRGEDIPHSCGQPCHKERGHGCEHKCSLPCHPGPCPQCPRTVTRACLCGNENKSVRCGSAQEIRCSKMCDKLLNCGKHKCAVICHSGGCEICQERIIQKCFCGCSEREVACTALNLQENGYSCGRACGGMFACGRHACEAKCHGGDCGPCPLSPERLVRCPCGKTELATLLSAPRQTCSDSVPVCTGVCDKVLNCGSQAKPHRCKALCHNGPCPPCPNNSSLRCRCQALTRTVPCVELSAFTDDNPLLCERRCKKQKSCKQHKCQEQCCVDVDHLCLQTCNRKLDCGIHTCDRLCHVGQCPRCLQASFEEQRCLCGMTVREPPIPCGAALPPCSEPCAREHTCEHPVLHNCHAEVDCPLCTFLTRKWCYGKHELRSNIPCYLKDVSCGKACEKTLSCGVHRCLRICHSGDCVGEGDECKQSCAVIREACGHPCGVSCHGKNDCPKSTCASQVQVTCACGRKSSTMCCSDVDKTNAKAQAARAMDAKTTSGSVRILQRQDSSERYKCLPCDSECARAQRNRKLAMALELDRDEDNPLPMPGDPTYTDFLRSQTKANPTVVVDVENALIQLVQSTETQRTTNTRNHVFRPMAADMRRLIHEYAAYFRVDTLSYDPEPQRNVVATAKRGQSFVPMTLLSSFIHKAAPKIAPPPQKSAWGIMAETKENSSTTVPIKEGMQMLTPATAVVRRLTPMD